MPLFHTESSQPSSSLPSSHPPTLHSTLPPPPSAQPPSVFQLDASDVSYVSTRLDHYVALYQSDVASRLQSLVLRHQSDSQTIAAQSAAIQTLQQRVEAMQDAVHDASSQSSLHEQSHAQLRDRYLAHLTRQHRSARLVHSFRQWRDAIADSQTAQQRVGRHRTRALQRGMFAQWRSNARRQRREADASHWQQQLSLAREAAVREKGEEVRRLKEEMAALLVTARLHESDKAEAEERMRQAFVRGVCALNKEALSVFGAHSNQAQPQPYSGAEEKVQEEKWGAASAASSVVSSITHGSSHAGSVSQHSHSSSVVTFQPIPLRLSHPYPPVQSPVVSSSAMGSALKRSGSAVGGGGGGGMRSGRAASTKR